MFQVTANINTAAKSAAKAIIAGLPQYEVHLDRGAFVEQLASHANVAVKSLLNNGLLAENIVYSMIMEYIPNSLRGDAPQSATIVVDCLRTAIMMATSAIDAAIEAAQYKEEVYHAASCS